MMEREANDDYAMCYTDDPTPCNRDDTEISPQGHPVHRFEEVTYLGETSPGEVSFRARQRIGSSPSLVHRICSVTRGHLEAFHFIEDGLYPDGVDVFEIIFTHRLVDGSLPKTCFGSEIGGRETIPNH